MTAVNYILIFVCVGAISAGQILFKLAGLNTVGAQNILLSKGAVFAVAGLAIYGAATLMWIYMLRSVPLSVAYPFMALSYVIVPLAGYFVFSENVSFAYMAGIGLIVAGVTVTALS